MRLPARVRPDYLGVTAILLGGTMIAALGLADVPRGWIVAGTFLLTAAGVFVSHAVRPDIAGPSRISALGWAIACLVAFILGVAAYNVRFDPSRRQGTRLWEFVVRDYAEEQCLPLRGEPGGAELTLDVVDRPLQGLCGGHTFFFECREALS